MSSEISHDTNVVGNQNLNKHGPFLGVKSEHSPSNRRIQPKPKPFSGARRSLFSEPSILKRLLPLDARQSDKPLGFEAYQQFKSMSKSDVLPKYFFENEDEEAVYYLKIKYLDDDKSKP